MEELSKIVIAALPILGVVLGASVQHYFSRSSEAKKQIAALRSAAYVDYLRAVSMLARGRGGAEINTILASAADAKSRIVIYGSSKVIAKLAEFEIKGAVLNTPERGEAFLSMFIEMRKDGGAEDQQIAIEHLRLVLFGFESYPGEKA